MFRQVSGATLVGLCVGFPAWADEFDDAVRGTLGGDPAAYRQVIEGFQAAVRNGDGKAAAALVSYPITVEIGGKKVAITDAGAFAARFSDIVTPGIAGAVATEQVGDMMVNDQGVMLGQGEVWVSGICLDTGCKRSEVKVITIQSGPDDAPTATPASATPPAPAAAPQGVGALKSFGDWVVGCDNFRACVALGLGADDGTGGYVAIRRGGDSGAQAQVALSMIASDQPKEPALRLRFGPSKTPFPDTTLPVEAAGSYLVATVGPEMAPDLIRSLLAAPWLDLVEMDGKTAGDPQQVSLKGSAAALLYMDDQQRRVGTETALTRTGAAPASGIPAVPVAPTFAPVVMRALPDPLPPLPKGVKPPADESCASDVEPIAFRLSDAQTLWGVCSFAAAYNTGYTMWLVGPDGADKVDFSVPGLARTGDDDPSVLVNPSLNPDGLGLNATNLGRGVGDCGTLADWGWDGHRFGLLQYREMDVCRGVSQDDWPVLWLYQPG